MSTNNDIAIIDMCIYHASGKQADIAAAWERVKTTANGEPKIMVVNILAKAVEQSLVIKLTSREYDVLGEALYILRESFIKRNAKNYEPS